MNVIPFPINPKVQLQADLKVLTNEYPIIMEHAELGILAGNALAILKQDTQHIGKTNLHLYRLACEEVIKSPEYQGYLNHDDDE